MLLLFVSVTFSNKCISVYKVDEIKDWDSKTKNCIYDVNGEYKTLRTIELNGICPNVVIYCE